MEQLKSENKFGGSEKPQVHVRMRTPPDNDGGEFITFDN